MERKIRFDKKGEKVSDARKSRLWERAAGTLFTGGLMIAGCGTDPVTEQNPPIRLDQDVGNDACVPVEYSCRPGEATARLVGIGSYATIDSLTFELSGFKPNGGYIEAEILVKDSCGRVLDEYPDPVEVSMVEDAEIELGRTFYRLRASTLDSEENVLELAVTQTCEDTGDYAEDELDAGMDQDIDLDPVDDPDLEPEIVEPDIQEIIEDPDMEIDDPVDDPPPEIEDVPEETVMDPEVEEEIEEVVEEEPFVCHGTFEEDSGDVFVATGTTVYVGGYGTENLGVVEGSDSDVLVNVTCETSGMVVETEYEVPWSYTETVDSPNGDRISITNITAIDDLGSTMRIRVTHE